MSMNSESEQYKRVSVWDSDAVNYESLELPCQIFNLTIDELNQSVFWQNLFKYAKGISLEIGCGTGKNSLALSRKGVTPILLDFSKDTILYAKTLFRENRANGHFVVADMLHLPFRSEAFDFVHSDSSLEHIVGFEVAIKEISKVLKPNCNLFVTVPNKSRVDGSDLHTKIAHVPHLTNSFTSRQLRKSFNKHFKVIDVFGYDVISPSLMVIIRSISKLFSKKVQITGSSSRSVAKLARSEAGQSIIEIIFLQWLDKGGIIQQILSKWLVSRQPCTLGFNLCIIAEKLSE